MVDLVKEIAEEERAQGREEGREEGRKEERLALAKRLLEMGDGVEKVSAVTGLSLDEVQSLLAH